VDTGLSSNKRQRLSSWETVWLMLRFRKITALGLTTFVVYALVVMWSGVVECSCRHGGIACGTHDTALCPESYEQAELDAVCHHGSEPQGTGFSSRCCQCSILPTAMATWHVPAFGTLTSSSGMRGAAKTPCLPNSAVDSGISYGGIRPPPLGFSLNPAIASLQSIFLII